ncbi:MAG: BrnA antitoxin family protein [Paracoccaceae bacterium]|nr:BrnA antitoxin family protein [Paracoccaceae bacterium]
MHKPTKMTKAQLLATSLYIDAMRMIEWDLHEALMDKRTVPLGWQEIATKPYPTHPKKTRVTLWVDADVVRAFKGLGRGYQSRMNRVLRAWLLARAAKLVEGPDTTDYILNPERIEELQRWKRPNWGDTEQEIERSRR